MHTYLCVCVCGVVCLSREGIAQLNDRRPVDQMDHLACFAAGMFALGYAASLFLGSFPEMDVFPRKYSS